MADEITTEKAVELLNSMTIVDFKEYLACTQFTFSDDSELTYWDSDGESSRAWEYEEAPSCGELGHDLKELGPPNVNAGICQRCGCLQKIHPESTIYVHGSDATSDAAAGESA